MATTDDDARVLEIVFDGQIGHRENQLDSLAKKARAAANALQAIGAESARCKVERERYTDTDLAVVESLILEARKALEAVRQADVTIGNIENLSRGRMKFFGTNALPKGQINVTHLSRTPTTTPASGSPKTTRPQSGADNPGRERQRQRKQASDNQ